MLPPIFTTLRASNTVVTLVSSRIYRHGSAPQDVVTPYVTWSVIAGVPENTLSELPSIDRLPVQIDCWHPTDAGIEELAKAVRDAIEPHAHMTGIPLDGRDPETKLYRIGMQFDWWEPR